VSEIADLWFHSLVLLAHDRVDPLAPLRVLERRHARG
jgi:phosphoribosyl-ATP pyrophosphohydrolase